MEGADAGQVGLRLWCACMHMVSTPVPNMLRALKSRLVLTMRRRPINTAGNHLVVAIFGISLPLRAAGRLQMFGLGGYLSKGWALSAEEDG